MSHCAPEATLKPIHFELMAETVLMSLLRKCASKLFQTRGPATAKLLSPDVLCVCAERDTISWWKSIDVDRFIANSVTLLQLNCKTTERYVKILQKRPTNCKNTVQIQDAGRREFSIIIIIKIA